MLWVILFCWDAFPTSFQNSSPVGKDLIWAEYDWTLRTPGMPAWVHRGRAVYLTVSTRLLYF